MAFTPPVMPGWRIEQGWYIGPLEYELPLTHYLQAPGKAFVAWATNGTHFIAIVGEGELEVMNEMVRQIKELSAPI
jgi:hypothetical protein